MDEEDNVDFNSLSSLAVLASGGTFIGLDPTNGGFVVNNAPRDTTPSSETVDEYMKLFIEE